MRSASYDNSAPVMYIIRKCACLENIPVAPIPCLLPIPGTDDKWRVFYFRVQCYRATNRALRQSVRPRRNELRELPAFVKRSS